MSDDVAVVGGSQARADAEQGVESRCGVAAAVPAEHELVEVAAQMGAAQAMEGSERPALHLEHIYLDDRAPVAFELEFTLKDLCDIRARTVDTTIRIAEAASVAGPLDTYVAGAGFALATAIARQYEPRNAPPEQA